MPAKGSGSSGRNDNLPVKFMRYNITEASVTNAGFKSFRQVFYNHFVQFIKRFNPVGRQVY